MRGRGTKKAETAPVEETEVKAPAKEATAAIQAVPAEKAEAVQERKKRGRKPGTVKKTETEKKPAEKKEAEKNVYIQFSGSEYKMEDIMENIKAVWAAEGHRPSSIKKIDMYIKPEEKAAYYVINGKNSGKIDL